MTGIVVNRSSARRFAAVSALVAAPLAYLNIAIYLIVSGGDMSLLFDSARALTLSPSLIDLFRLGMVLDSFGFYLLSLPIGGYLWATLRRDGGSVVDAAVLFLVAYVILGDRTCTRMNSSHQCASRLPSSARKKHTTTIT